MSLPQQIMYELEHAPESKLTNKQLAERMNVDVDKVKSATSRLAKKGTLVALNRGKEYEYGPAYHGASN
jgi:Mn-dependent DtxR family transcriptional regulator